PYTAYINLRPKYYHLPEFYFDCSDLLLKLGDRYREKGMRILTNIVELDMVDPQHLRTAAYRLQQLALDIGAARKRSKIIPNHDIKDEFDALDLAIYLLKEVLLLRNNEPQAHRDLALVL